MTPQRRLWQIPVMWLVVGLPLASVIAGVSLVVIAIRAGGADTVTDQVDRVGQIQTADLGPDDNARQLGLSAVLRLHDGAIDVLPVNGRFDRDQPLQLLLIHPTQAARDQAMQLQPTVSGWRADWPAQNAHDWKLELASADGRWRLRGRLPRQQLAAHLGSSPDEAAPPQ